jgi:hypothetical protein
VSLVALWQVLGYGGKSPFVSAAPVAGHALAPVQHLYHMSRHAQLQHLPNQGVGGAVAMALKLDMTIYMHPHGLKDVSVQQSHLEIGSEVLQDCVHKFDCGHNAQYFRQPKIFNPTNPSQIFA